MNEWEGQLLEDKTIVDHVVISDVELRVGDRVRLLPRQGGDILDIALKGQIATIESIQQDYEGKSHFGVVLDDDAGRDLGLLRQPGHRFFFDTSDVQPLSKEEPRQHSSVPKPRVLVAGIGNIFLGDDGFGVEVARRLLTRPRPDAVRIVDFGIRGLDLAYALQDGYENTILVDAFPHGQTPGTVSIVQPDLNELSASAGDFVQPHAMHPMNVLRMAAALNGPLKGIVLVGCEPADLGGDEGHMGLSQVVEAALDEAVNRIEVLVNEILDRNKM